jgi:hypothetical protein
VARGCDRNFRFGWAARSSFKFFSERWLGFGLGIAGVTLPPECPHL